MLGLGKINSILLVLMLFIGIQSAMANQIEYSLCDKAIASPIQIQHSAWSLDLEQTRAQTPSLSLGDIKAIKPAWAFVFKDAVRPRSLPAVTKQAIYIGSETGRVLALDPISACVFWYFDAPVEVRSAINVVPHPDNSNAAIIVFADMHSQVYALDAHTGKLLWQRRAGVHAKAVATGSPRVVENQVLVPLSSLEVKDALMPWYHCCDFRGSLVSLDLLTGAERWRYWTIAEQARPQHRNLLGFKQYGPSGAAIWSSPTVDLKNRRVFVGTGQNYSQPVSPKSDAIIALNLDTGKEVWSHQFGRPDAWNAACTHFMVSINCPKDAGADADFGAPPILVRDVDGKDLILAGQKDGSVHVMEADSGKLLWSKKLGRGGLLGGVHWGMTADADSVYVPISDINISGAKDPEGERLPGLYKLDILSGQLQWSTNAFASCQQPASVPAVAPPYQQCRQGLSAALSLVGNYIFAAELDGWLRVYDKDNGELVWSFDASQSVMGINGYQGKGGTLDAGGVIYADGRLYLNAGYGGFLSAGGTAGNVFWVLELPAAQIP